MYSFTALMFDEECKHTNVTHEYIYIYIYIHIYNIINIYQCLNNKCCNYDLFTYHLHIYILNASAKKSNQSTKKSNPSKHFIALILFFLCASICIMMSIAYIQGKCDDSAETSVGRFLRSTFQLLCTYHHFCCG